jgi:hypothetical protein
MLAVCSDLDGTPDRNVYYELMRYLNTTDMTSMGPGVGLEVGNTIYFDMPPHQFSYWTTDEPGREMVRTLIQSGHIDCLHSYGELTTTRQHVERCISELQRHRCRIAVWVDHSTAPSNFGPDIMGGRGDVTGSDIYHADISCAFGIRYVWRGRVTSIIGQDVEPGLFPIWSPRHPLRSANTLGKELLKGMLARAGNEKYAMHLSNRLMRPVKLRSGHDVIEFIRFNPYWGGVGFAATADGLAEVLVEKTLTTLVKREGISILYTHMGKIGSRQELFNARTRRALERLAAYHREGQILLATTHRLLRYRESVHGVRLSSQRDGDWLRVHAESPASASDLTGMTVYVDEPEKTRLFINQTEITNLKRNPADHTGRRSISLPWSPLGFPVLGANYRC